MPLSLWYFYVRSLNTLKELSCLVYTGVHLGEGLGNPPSHYQQRALMLSLHLLLKDLFCRSLLLLSSDVNAGESHIILAFF